MPEDSGCAGLKKPAEAEQTRQHEALLEEFGRPEEVVEPGVAQPGEAAEPQEVVEPGAA